MKTIVFIGTQKSGSSREAIKAAQELGYFTVLLTNKEKQLAQRKEYMDVHMMKYCDTTNIKEMIIIIEALIDKAFVIIGIVSFVDSYVHTACLLANHFNVNHFSTEAIYNMENKLISRDLIKNTPYVPSYQTIESDESLEEEEVKSKLPGMLKSPVSTGSKDVYKVDNYEEYKSCLEKLRKKYPEQPIIFEEYLDGPQYLVETLVIRGQVYIMAIVEQEISYINDHFIVTGYYLVIEPNPIFFRQLKKAVVDIINLHLMKNGSCHLELRYIKNQWKLIEINPRISGGGMNQLLYAGYGINLVKETLKLALYQVPYIVPKTKRHVYIQYTTITEEGIMEKVTGKNRAMTYPGVIKVYIKPRKGNVVSKPKSMGHRYAYVLATGGNKEEAIKHAKDAIKEIEFNISEKK